MIERILYFSLGFFAAFMMGLAVLPAFWRRAYRLTRREVEATLPLSPREIAAERDQLRAKFAVERIQLEQQIETINAKRHGAMKEAGDRTTTIATLGDNLEARKQDIAALSAERTEQSSIISRLQKELQNTQETLGQRSTELETTHTARIDLRNKLDTTQAALQAREADITALKSNMAAQFQRVEDLASAVKTLKEQVRTSSEEAKATERRLRETEKDRSILSRKLDSAEELATRRDATIVDRDHKIAVLHEKAMALAAAGKEMEASLKQEARKATQSDALLKAREETITRIREDSAETARDLTKSIEKIRADRQRLQTELTELRTKSMATQRELTALKRNSTISDLRAGVSEERATK